MKEFFAKFGISSALDRGQPVPDELRRRASKSGDTGDFLERAETVDRMLRRHKPGIQSPAGLHGSIMRAVSQARHAEAQPRMVMPRWMPAMGFAVMLVFAALWGLRLHERSELKTAGADTLALATQALEMSREFAQTLPAKVMEPVSGELKKINEDVDNTAKYLLASIPLDGLMLAAQ